MNSATLQTYAQTYAYNKGNKSDSNSNTDSKGNSSGDSTPSDKSKKLPLSIEFAMCCLWLSEEHHVSGRFLKRLPILIYTAAKVDQQIPLREALDLVYKQVEEYANSSQQERREETRRKEVY